MLPLHIDPPCLPTFSPVYCLCRAPLTVLHCDYCQQICTGLCHRTWLQVLTRPAQPEGPDALSGMAGMENGMVDLQMATEAFRDAFSACAPPLEGPSDTPQDYLLAEAYKSPANPATGATRLTDMSGIM